MARYQHTGIAHVLNRRIETEAMRADGTVFPVELTITPVSTEDGEFFTATLRDISERLRTEAALRESQSLLAKTGSIGGIGGWQLDVATGIVTSTEESCRIHDIPPGSRGSLDQRDIERDKILSAAEAKEYGLIDEVLLSRKASLDA